MDKSASDGREVPRHRRCDVAAHFRLRLGRVSPHRSAHCDVAAPMSAPMNPVSEMGVDDAMRAELFEQARGRGEDSAVSADDDEHVLITIAGQLFPTLVAAAAAAFAMIACG